MAHPRIEWARRACAWALILGLSACRSPAAHAPSAQARVAIAVRGGDGRVHPLQVELACTEAARAQGLMGRTNLAPNHGMLFVFADSAPRTFWMHNTRIPLDLLFFGADGQLVGLIERAEPMTDTPRACPVPARMVLELAGGEAARRSLRGAVTLARATELEACARGAL